jgi:hypothetical protein
MIYKHQEQPQQALECLQAICDQPPPPLSQADVWYLIGSVQETMDAPAPDFAKQAYEHVLRLMQMNNEPKVARVYRQLGWVCHKWALELPHTVVAQMAAQQVRAPTRSPTHDGQTINHAARPLRSQRHHAASHAACTPPLAVAPRRVAKATGARRRASIDERSVRLVRRSWRRRSPA